MKTFLVLFHSLILDLRNRGFEQQAQSAVLPWRVGGGESHALSMGAGEGLPAPSWGEVGLSEFLLICSPPVALIGNTNLSPNT